MSQESLPAGQQSDRWQRFGLAAAATLATISLLNACESDPAANRAREVAPVTVEADPVELQTPPAEHSEAPTVPPKNVIMVIVDDMDNFSCQDTAKFLPESSKYLKDLGTCFEDARVASPVCCPSRAAFMTGQLPHNNRVRTIHDGDKITIEDTVQYALRKAGLTTYGVGKWLNAVSMEELADPAYDTGFSQENLWLPERYTKYKIINDEGKIVTPKNQPHTTVYTGNHLNAFVDDMLEQGEQFYAYGAFLAPHSQHTTETEKDTTPEPTAANRDKPVPPFVYDPERNTEDKLPIFQLPPRSLEHYERLHAARVRSEYDVDDQVAKLFETLDAHDALDTTAVIFTSDNGYEMGRNNWQYKGTPYPASLDVPLLAYLPGTFAAGAVDNRPVNLIDVTATFYELLGVTPEHQLDGHSLLSDYRREAEYYELDGSYRGDTAEHIGAIPSWSEYIKDGKSYIQYYDADGNVMAEEFYADPGDKRNLLYKDFADEAPSPEVLAWFRQQLEKSRGCAGTVESGAANPCP
jgi:arylsulfatase A-like enzyme